MLGVIIAKQRQSMLTAQEDIGVSSIQVVTFAWRDRVTCVKNRRYHFFMEQNIYGFAER